MTVLMPDMWLVSRTPAPFSTISLILSVTPDGNRGTRVLNVGYTRKITVTINRTDKTTNIVTFPKNFLIIIFLLLNVEFYYMLFFCQTNHLLNTGNLWFYLFLSVANVVEIQ